VWTSIAHFADWGICLARTDPDAPKHEGIGCFLVDMTSDGLDIRPLRELTGFEMFNEVFLTDVFVPDDCVVGAPTAGWQAARTTLGNERVSMGAARRWAPASRRWSSWPRPRRHDDPRGCRLDTIGHVVGHGAVAGGASAPA
jgi:3-oxochol-4-en-24-oyl-CoA dehydrogenase